MNKIYLILIIITTLIYSKGNTIIKNDILGIYKITKEKCLKDFHDNSVYDTVAFYEFKYKIDDNTSNEILFINWKSDYTDKYTLYYNASDVNIDNLNMDNYPITILLSDGKKDNYIETIQFLDKNHAIRKAGFKNGLIQEVYFERISQDEIKKYKRLFPESMKSVNKKGHISESYFNRISKENLSINKKNFKYSSKNLSKKELLKLYGLKEL